jgi:hypothetical protein
MPTKGIGFSALMDKIGEMRNMPEPVAAEMFATRPSIWHRHVSEWQSVQGRSEFCLHPNAAPKANSCWIIRKSAVPAGLIGSRIEILNSAKQGPLIQAAGPNRQPGIIGLWNNVT